MNHKDLLKLYKKNGGKILVEIKDREPAQPFQQSRTENYQYQERG